MTPVTRDSVVPTAMTAVARPIPGASRPRRRRPRPRRRPVPGASPSPVGPSTSPSSPRRPRRRRPPFGGRRRSLGRPVRRSPTVVGGARGSAALARRSGARRWPGRSVRVRRRATRDRRGRIRGPRRGHAAALAPLPVRPRGGPPAAPDGASPPAEKDGAGRHRQGDGHGRGGHRPHRELPAGQLQAVLGAVQGDGHAEIARDPGRIST